MRAGSYEAEAVRRALALDPSIGAPELRVQPVGDHLVVTGSVETRERREAIERCLAQRFGDRRIENHVEVVELGRSAPTED